MYVFNPCDVAQLVHVELNCCLTYFLKMILHLLQTASLQKILLDVRSWGWGQILQSPAMNTVYGTGARLASLHDPQPLNLIFQG